MTIPRYPHIVGKKKKIIILVVPSYDICASYALMLNCNVKMVYGYYVYDSRGYT